MTLEKLDASAQADAFRERIVTASTELIEEQGLSALSMREVARRAGVSPQAPYYYFADREAILAAIAEQGFRILGEVVERSVPQAVGDEQRAIVIAGKAYLAFALEHRAHFRVMFRPELVSAERNPNVLGEGLRACDQFYRIVARAVNAGLPAPASVDALFLLCWSVVHGLACLVLDGPLDKIMPGVNREGQLHDVFVTYDHLMNASLALAGRTTKASPDACVVEQPPKAPRSRKLKKGSK